MTTLNKVQVRFAVVFCTFLLFSCGKRNENDASDGSARSAGDRMQGGSQNAGNASEKALSKRAISADARQQKLLEDFVAKWDEISHERKGTGTLAKQKDLALSAVEKLGGCPELMEMLDFLTSKGAGDLRKEIIDLHLSRIFVGPNAREAREWVLTVNDKKLKEQLCRQAGEKFAGLGFKECFELTGAAAGLNCQASLLTGYCVAMAKTDPEGAVRVYREFAYPKHIDNSGMADIMSVIPANADFMKFAAEIKEDSMTLARRARAALLKNWTSVKPQDAAQYVLASSANTVNPEQMGVVIDTWAEKSPDAAAEWLNKSPAGKPRDEGIAALAKFWCPTDIAKAWQFAGQVGDFKKRVDTATVVFKEWEKTDKTAATAAWVALFPGK